MDKTFEVSGIFTLYVRGSNTVLTDRITINTIIRTSNPILAKDLAISTMINQLSKRHGKNIELRPVLKSRVRVVSY